MYDEVEARIRKAFDAKSTERALETAIEAYGQEVFGFLVSRLRDEDAAGDVFSQTCEDLWKSLPSFEWRCSMRTWMYKLARSASTRYERSPHHRAGRRMRLSQVSEIADRVRSRTVEHLRTVNKDRFAELRDELETDDQTLLTLRVDRGLSWNDVARVMSDEQLSEEEIERASARLRQRFKKVKDHLRDRAIATGLIPQD